MLVRFSVANYRSFRDTVELDMRATSLKEHRDTHIARVTVGQKTYDLLRSAVIYGPNASGKSNFIMAMAVMKRLVLDSATKFQADEPLPIQPFKLDPETRQAPSTFEIVFLHEHRRYRYGFRATRERIYEEWLYHARQREALLFHREGDAFYLSSRLGNAARLRKHTRPNALFLSVMAQFNHPLGISLRKWFRETWRILWGAHTDSFIGFTLEQLQNPEFCRRIQPLVRLADMGIDEVRARQVPIEEALAEVPPKVREILREVLQKESLGEEEGKKSVFHLQTRHKETFFDFHEESDGTQKFIALLGPLLHVLDHGCVLAVDEMEAHLHSFLTRTLISLFHSPKANPRHAQLIFTTHDLTLLDEALFRRDQIWFMEKTSDGATDFYSLADIHERPDVSLFKRYREGWYVVVSYSLEALLAYIEQEMSHAP